MTLVEYGDYECPFCRAAHKIMPEILADFRTNLRFVFRNFPIRTIHPHALRAAEVAEFAGTHGKFWQMHGLLFDNQERLGDALFTDLAALLNLPRTEMMRALQAGTFVKRIREDFRGGIISGVDGTPTFFINGVRFDRPIEKLAETIEMLLASTA